MTESTDKQLLDKASADEQQLEEYLRGDSSVSRQYRQLPGADVPVELDRLVLRQAEDAVKKRSAGRPAWLRWTAPLAVAASAVLVVSIVFEHGVRDTTVQEMASRNAAPTQAEVRKRVERKAQQSIAPEQPAEPQGSAESEADNQAADSRADVASPAEPPPPPKVATPAPQAMIHAAPVDEPTPAPSIRPTMPPAPAAPPPSEVAAAESVARSADVATRMVESAKVEGLAQGQPPVPNTSTREQEGGAAKAYSRINAEMRASPAQPYSDPEAWLKDIRQLRKDNKQEQADREWRRFRIAFPDYQVAETDTAREARK
jgi:hypothetical protein